jgi:hypothetical protein
MFNHNLNLTLSNSDPSCQLREFSNQHNELVLKLSHVSVSTAPGLVQSPHASFFTSAASALRTHMQPKTASRTPRHSSGQGHSLVGNSPLAHNPLPAGNYSCVVHIDYFEFLLQGHPNRCHVNYILDGLRNGFDIGFLGSSTATQPKNLRSAQQFKAMLSEAVSKEVQRGHTAGPFSSPPFPISHCSPIGAVEKSDSTCRLIVDLSQPAGKSVNEFIPKEPFSVKYSKFDDAVQMVLESGKGCFMSKLDIKHAFRIIPVHPSQWHLLCYAFDGHWYVDMVLPFGLRSSPAIFCQFADLVRWILANCYNIPMVINYSDDFFQVSGLELSQANAELNTILTAFHDLGIPVAPDKVFGPCHRLPYLGIVIDSLSMTMEVTEERYHECMTTLPRWLNRSKCTKTQLRSLIGKLAFVAKVARPGRLFLRRLIDLSKTVKKGHHHISLNADAKADIAWWYDFLPSWSRCNLIPESKNIYASDLKLFSDASDIGFGAIYGTAWIQGSWSKWGDPMPSIDYRELFAIVAAAETWGLNWAGKRIVFVTDNEPITQIWDKGSTPSRDIMGLIRVLFLTAAKRGYSVSLKYIAGVNNPIADALSRFQDNLFRDLLPDAELTPTPIPVHVWPQ